MPEEQWVDDLRSAYEELDDAAIAELYSFFDRIEQHTTQQGRNETEWRDPIAALKSRIQSDVGGAGDSKVSPSARWKALTSKMSAYVRNAANSLYPLNPISRNKGTFLPIRFQELRDLISGSAFNNIVIVTDPGDSSLEGGDKLEKEELEKINKDLKTRNKTEVSWVNPEPATMLFSYDDTNPFRLEDAELAGGKKLYLGFPKLGLAFDKTIQDKQDLANNPNGGVKSAVFSIETSSITLEDNILTVYFKEENLQEIKSEWASLISVPLNDSSKDTHFILVGRYVSLEDADLDGYKKNLIEGAKTYGANGISDMINGVGEAIGGSIDSLATKEFYCCIFYELIRSSAVTGVTGEVKIYRVDSGGNIIVRTRYDSVSEYEAAYAAGDPITLEELLENPAISTQHIEMFLQEQKIWLRQLHALLMALIPLLTGESMNFNWPGFKFNIAAIMHTSITIMLVTMLNVVQQHLFEQAVQWGKERIEASDNPSVAVQCLPWEQLFMSLIVALFGPDGWSKNVREMILNMQEYMMKKAKEVAGEGEDVSATGENHPWLPKLNAAIDVIDWLLDLNAQAFMICATQRPDKFEADSGAGSASDPYKDKETGEPHEPPPTSSTIGRRTGTGLDYTDGRGTVDIKKTSDTGDGSKDGSFYSPTAGLGRQIDITGEKINPVALLIEQKDEDVAKFFAQYMGLTQEEANEAVSKAKKGECVKVLGANEIQELKNALTNVGLEY